MSGRSKMKRKNFLRRFLKNWRYARVYGSRWGEALRLALRRAWRDDDFKYEDALIAAYTYKREHNHEDSANKGDAMAKKLTGPLFVRKDEHGELFLCNVTPTDLDLNDSIVLDDVTLWDAYMVACRAQQEAAQGVLSNLRKPARTEVEIRVLPTPASDEIRALAFLYVTERLRSCRKINMAFSALAGVSEAQVESAWGLAKPIAEPVPSEMVEALHSKGWISNVGGGCYTLTCSGEAQLDTAVTTMMAAQAPVPA